MADTDIETLQNGTATLSLEEEERLKQRPADIDADVREMERRKRVEALMSSKLFREELERVLDQQMHEGGDAPLLQRIREMVGGRLHSGSMRGPTCVLPINDIRGIEGVGYEKGEKILRCKLAAVYRLVDLFGWTQTGVNGQITARLNTAVESVLTTPRGLLPHEVTASSLVKVDMQGAVQDQGTTNFPINVEGFSLHAAVHAARPDIRCVLHVRSASALAVSCMSGGLLPLCHEACALGECVSHRAPKGILDNEEKDKLVRALGPHSKVLILSNSGALCCGATLEEAFHHARLLVAAADVQLRLASVPLDRLELFDEETRKQIYDAAHKPPNDQAKWRVGGEEFEGLMRMLDNAGFRTGYIYRHPLIKNDVPKPKNDVEVPPAVSSLGYLLEEEELYKQGLWKKGGGKTGERTRWLNSPNVYQKVEVLETGTTDPKKITKWVDANTDEWVQDGSPAHSSTPVKIDTLQFVPKNTNPKEFKKLQQQIKENRRADKISAGPQSHILEGVTWDEASKLVGEDAVNTQTGDHVVLMGAASKGIIQRGYQHNATMYSAPYARNPFDHVTDTEIEDYRRAVERKRTGNEYDTDLSESEAISGAQITSPASAPSETEEESRDEHRVLRIETTQAPIRSQPEVVLSDVDTTDFLNAERSHADRTKDTRDPTVMSDDDVFLPAPAPRGPIVARAHHRDPNLLSDDEVFLDSAASTVTSSVSGVTSPQPPPRNVIIRAQTIAVAQKLQGTNENDEALTCSQRSRHDFPRSPSFDSIVKIYDSPEIIDAKTHPKCKVSLSNKLDNADFKNYGFAKVSVSKRLEVGDAKSLNKLEEGITSSRSSLYSIASIEWDGRCKSEHAFRTRSLPRQRISSLDIYRTRSHSGFINSYIRDPEPLHYHIPRCRSCSAVNISPRSVALKTKLPTSLYLSVDKIHLKSNNETEIVKVKEVELPLFKVPQVPEFVDSQEFNEDNYLADVNSFSSNNQTVIEKNCDVTLTKEEVDDEKTNESVERSSELYRAEYAQIETDENDNTMETEGEYQSFSDDFEEAYESPVKDLVEKDIRDYSVPINFYCEDYRKDSPKKSPLKCREQPKNVLEPILEESKSSYGDDSSNLSQDKQEFDVKAFAEKTVGDVIDVALTVVESNQDCGVRNEDAAEIDVKTNDDNSCKVVDTKIEKETEFKSKKLYENNKENNVQSSDDVNLPHNIKMFGNVKTPKFDDVEIPTVIELSPNDIDNKNDGLFNSDHKLVDDKDQRKSSIEYSVTSTPNEIASFDSTVEFEIYEAITDLLACILNKIDYEGIGREFFNLPEKKHAINLFDEKDSKTPALVDEREVNNIVNIKNVKENITENTDNNFSITKLIQEFEETYPILLNDTILTESSDGGITEPFKIVESLMYYIFDRVFVIENGKNKKKANKRVVTVVDSEDIMYTAATLWPDYDENENFGVVFNRQEEINDAYEVIAENENVVDANNNEGPFEILEAEIEDPNSWAEFDVNEHRNENADMNDGSEHASLEKRNNQYRDEFAPNENNIVTEFNDANDLRSTNSKHEKYEEETEVEFHGYDTNESNQDPCLTTESLNETEFEMVLNTNMDLIQNDHTAACNKDISTTDDKECKELSRISIEITEDIAFEYKTSTTNDYENDELDDYDDDIKVDNDFTNDTQVDKSDEEYTDDVTTSKNKDTMNTAFVNDEFHSHSSSPCKESQIFDACDESPIRKPTNSFIGQELTIKYKDDTLLGSPFVKYDDVPSPFVKQSSVISMSQTENSGGIKYWLSFDDSFTESRDYKRRSIKNTDDTIPSFYGINFSDRLNAFNKRSILINDNSDGTFESQKDDVPSPTSSNCYDTCESALLDDSLHKPYDVNSPKYQSNSHQRDVNRSQYDINSSQYDINSSQYDINSPQYDINSLQYDVNSRYDLESPRNLLGVQNPQKKLLYEVQRRNDRLCMSWPPFEDTLFYRIISKFRMSESFDSSEHTVNGDHSDAHQSTFSHSSKEGSPSKEVSTEDSPKKDKKKKKGLRTPSFLKKKKEKKKEKSSTPQPA